MRKRRGRGSSNGLARSTKAGAEGLSRRFFNAVMGLGFAAALSGFAGVALAYLRPLRGATGAEFLYAAQGKVTGTQIRESEAVVGRSHLGKIKALTAIYLVAGLAKECAT